MSPSLGLPIGGRFRRRRQTHHIAFKRAGRLRRARDLLAVRGYQAEETVLACYSGQGFSNGLRALTERDQRILLVGLDRLCQRAARPGP